MSRHGTTARSLLARLVAGARGGTRPTHPTAGAVSRGPGSSERGADHLSPADAPDDRERASLCRSLLAGVAARLSADPRGLSPRAVERALSAMATVPRDRFVPGASLAAAYEDRPLSIGRRQTISQPTVVARMTALLDLGPSDRVLEVGTGCGYQTAVLARLAGTVHSVERIRALAATAAARLGALGLTGIELAVRDGAEGWPEHAPFDAIIVTAAAPGVPPALLRQLAEPGRMVIPVDLSGHGLTQELLYVVKQAGGAVERTPIAEVAFVPLLRGVDEPEPGA